jgi:uncharacterized protein (AIM24 family)
MQHQILGEVYQWLKIEMESESIRGNYRNLLCKSEDIKIGEGNVFSGTGELVLSGNGKIKELYMGDTDSILLTRNNMLAADITTGETPFSTNYLSLVKFSGPGTVFVSGKEFAEFYLKEEETVEVRTVCIVAMDGTVTFELGSRFSTLSGPGAVLLKSFIPFKEDVVKESTEFSLFDQL